MNDVLTYFLQLMLELIQELFSLNGDNMETTTTNIAPMITDVLYQFNEETDDYNYDTDSYNDTDIGLEICVEKILSEEEVDEIFTLLLYYTLVATGICIVIFALLIKRKRIKLDLWNGRPGIPIPMNLIQEQENRFSFLAAIALTTWVVLDAIFGDSHFEWTNIHPYTTVFLKFVSFLLIGLIYWPIFASLSSKHWLGYAIGSVYIWWITAISMLNSLPCKHYPDKRDAVVYVFTTTPLVVLSIFLCISMPIRCIQSILNLNGHKISVFKFRSQHFYELHVKSLMNGNKKKREKEQTKVQMILETGLYHSLPGFKYSLGMLAAVWIGILFVYLVSIITFNLFWLLSKWLLKQLTPLLEASKDAQVLSAMAEEFGFGKNDTELLKVIIVETNFWANLTSALLYASVGCAFTLTATSLLLTLKNYRKNLLNIYKGKYKHIPNCSTWSGRQILVPAVKFTGFQLGYAVWGYMIQWFSIFIILFILSTFFCLVFRYGMIGLLYWVMEKLLPPLVYIVLLYVLQNIIVYFLFILRAEEGNRVTLALNNRRAFFNYHYFMLFINAPLGLFSCLLRILKSIVIGLWVLPRLDMSTLNRHTERFDGGFIAYVSMLLLENTLTNPVMLVFLKSLREATTNKAHGLKGKSRRFLIVRNRWQVLLTLYNNPNLIVRRKAVFKSEKYNGMFKKSIPKLKSNDLELSTVSNSVHNSYPNYKINGIININFDSNEDIYADTIYL